MSRLIDISGFKELEYPKELKGSWFYYVFLKDHPEIDGIACVYFNDKKPSGSIYVGEHILNDYPDVYATWGKEDKDLNVIANRMLVSKNIRNYGIGKASLLYGGKCLKILFNKTLTHVYGSEAGNKLYSSAFNVDPIEDTSVEQAIDLREDFFDQPIYPYVFFGRRVSK